MRASRRDCGGPPEAWTAGSDPMDFQLKSRNPPSGPPTMDFLWYTLGKSRSGPWERPDVTAEALQRPGPPAQIPWIFSQSPEIRPREPDHGFPMLYARKITVWAMGAHRCDSRGAPEVSRDGSDLVDFRLKSRNPSSRPQPWISYAIREENQGLGFKVSS